MTFETIREVNADVDETKLSLAINNLIENAIKYNKDGGYVKVSIDADHKFFYINVKDSGDGIAPEYKDLIFERFYRMDSSRNSSTGGYGIGLSLAKSIITMHKGRVSARSIGDDIMEFEIRL